MGENDNNQQLDSMRWFSHRRSPSPPGGHAMVSSVAAFAYGLRRTPYYALSMGMTPQVFAFVPGYLDLWHLTFDPNSN